MLRLPGAHRSSIPFHYEIVLPLNVTNPGTETGEQRTEYFVYQLIILKHKNIPITSTSGLATILFVDVDEKNKKPRDRGGKNAKTLDFNILSEFTERGRIFSQIVSKSKCVSRETTEEK